MNVMRRLRLLPAAAIVVAALASLVGCGRTSPLHSQRAFRTPEDAVKALDAAIAKGDLVQLGTIFGPDGQALLDTSDPIDARQRREVFTVAMAEGWRLVDEDGGKTLVIGNEAWPFPVPLAEHADGWRFDTAAGKEEVLARRIGRNELAAIRACLGYVRAQRAYAAEGHDGKPAGLYAQRVRSDPGTQNGLYWPASPGEKRSPLGDLIAAASGGATVNPVRLKPDSTSPDSKPDSTSPDSKPGSTPPDSKPGSTPPDSKPDSTPPDSTVNPFHGYYFRILTAQGPHAQGGIRNFVSNGEMSDGFALVAWPAQYDVTGIMTFLVNQEGGVHEKDLGPDTEAAVAKITVYDPDQSWSRIP